MCACIRAYIHTNYLCDDVTTISKSQSLTSVSIKDCTLRVPNETTTFFLLRAIIKAIFASLSVKWNRDIIMSLNSILITSLNSILKKPAKMAKM